MVDFATRFLRIQDTRRQKMSFFRWALHFFLVFMNMPNVSADAVSANFSFLVCSRHRGRALVGFFVGLRLPNAKVCSYALVLLSVGQDCFLVVSATTTKCQ